MDTNHDRHQEERGEEEEVQSSPLPTDHVTRARDQMPRANAHETCLPVILLCCAPLVPNLPNFPSYHFL